MQRPLAPPNRPPAADPGASPPAVPVQVLPDTTDRLRRRPRWWPELAVIAWLAWIYDLINGYASLREHAALAHGTAILQLETTLHLDPEHGMDIWLSHHPLLGVAAGDFYDNAHFIATFAVLGWLWWRHPERYRPLRNAIVAVNVVGFAVFWLFPVAPPRLLPGRGFVDIVAVTHAIGGWHTGTLGQAADQFAAMPSLHLGWSSWCALATWQVWRGRRLAGLVWLYPAVTAVAVMATGNHYLADCVAGVATTALTAAAAYHLPGLVARLRHRHGTAAADARAAASAATGVDSTPIAGKVAQATKAHG